MARIRTFKSSFWTDSKTGTLSGLATKLFLGMLNHADDVGMLRYNPLEMKAQILPYETGSPDEVVVRPLVDELISKGLVLPFLLQINSQNGAPPIVDHSGNVPGAFLRIPNFLRHQRIDKPGEPLLPGWQKNDTWDTFVARAGDSLNENIDTKQIDMNLMLPSSNTIPVTFQEPSNSVLTGREGKGREKDSKGEDKEAAQNEPNAQQPEEPTQPLTVIGGNEPKPKEPKPPTDDMDDFYTVSWWFLQGRKALYDDNHYFPYNGRNLKTCKALLYEDGAGDMQEVWRRMRFLFSKQLENPESDFHSFGPANMRQRWPQCVGVVKEMTKAQKQTKEGARRAAFLERMKDYEGSG